MSLFRNTWVLTSAAVLGLGVAACSSKNTDAGGGGTGNNSNGGGNPGGGAAAATGGKGSLPTATGGAQTVTNTGGSTAFDPNTYCNGIFSGQVCGTTNVEADVRTVNMLLVLDESGSMNDKASPSDALNKWGIMKAALTSALTSVQNDINFGLLLYPYDPNGPIDTSSIVTSCSVPVDASAIVVPIPSTPDPNNLTEILNVVGSHTPAGGTPTARALQQAYNYFQTGDGKNLAGSRWVLLATDGGPNCNVGLQCTKETCTQNLDLQCGDKTATTPLNCCDPAQTGVSNSNMSCLDGLAATSQIANLAAIGVKTFVVGVPGSEAYANTLNGFANAGQEPNTGGSASEQYYAVSAASAKQDLTDAFATITTQLVKKCNIPLATPPTDITQVTVTIDCQKVTRVTTGTLPDAGVDGYYIDINKTPAQLQIVGAPCDNITANGVHHVDVILGCSLIK